VQVILPATITISLFYLALALFVLRNRQKQEAHYLLAAAAGALFVWTFLAYFAYASPTYDRLRFWYHLSCLGMFFYYPLNHHFVFSLTKPYLPISRRVYPLIVYLPFAVLFIRELDLGVSMAGFERLSFGWKFLPAAGTPWNTAWVLLASASAIASMIYMARAARKTTLNRERKQFRLLSTALAATLLITLGEYLLAARVIPAWTVVLSPILQSPWILAMVVAIEKYQFMNLMPEAVAKDILRITDEAILLVDLEGKVVYANPSARRLVDHHGRSTSFLPGVFELPRELHAVVEASVTVPETSVTPETSTAEGGPRRPEMVTRTVVVGSQVYRVRYRAVYDKFGDFLGILILCALLRALSSAQREFGLTDREQEVLELLVTGWTNADVAISLGITERTVKAHISSIYAKLGVVNKVELLNMITAAGAQ
jgi:DNA-binding CsgD family transcriptional regulator